MQKIRSNNGPLNHGQERRDFVRVKANIRVSYEIISGGAAKSGIIRNLSGEGLLFTSDELLPVATLLRLTLILPPDEGFIKVFALVVRSYENESGKYDIAMCFIGLPTKQRQDIIEYVQEKINQSGTS